LETFKSCDVVTSVNDLCCGLQDGSRRSPLVNQWMTVSQMILVGASHQ